MTTHYTRTAKALHWLMAMLLIGLLALGFYMHDLPLSPEKMCIRDRPPSGHRQR